MIRKEKIIKSGKVLESLPNATFVIELEDTKEKVICYIGGKMKLHKIKILPGDKVLVEISPYDKKKGRIIFRG